MRTILTLTILLAGAGAWAQPQYGPYAAPQAEWITSGTEIVGLARTTDTVRSASARDAAATVWDWAGRGVECVRELRRRVNQTAGASDAIKLQIHEAASSASSVQWTPLWNAFETLSVPVRRGIRKAMIQVAAARARQEVTRLRAQALNIERWATLMEDQATSAVIP